MSDEPVEAPLVALPVYPDDTLVAALARHNVAVADDRREILERYCRSLWDWNEKINLTRHTDYERFVARDVIDCVHLASQLLPNEEVLDLGSGGGVPGVVLQILRPDLTVICSDSVGKKAKALEAIVREIKLPIRVFSGRAEKLLADDRFDAVVARGVGSLAKLLTWLKPHWLSVGRLLAIKGPKWPDERGEARHHGLMHGLELRVAVAYPMPGTESESVVLKIWPAGAKER